MSKAVIHICLVDICKEGRNKKLSSGCGPDCHYKIKTDLRVSDSNTPHLLELASILTSITHESKNL